MVRLSTRNMRGLGLLVAVAIISLSSAINGYNLFKYVTGESESETDISSETEMMTTNIESRNASEEEANVAAAQEAKLKAEEEAKSVAEKQATAAEEKNRLKAEEEAKLKAEEDVNVATEEEAKLEVDVKNAVVVIEECGCPHTEKIQKLMRQFGDEDCRLSNCTNYELDASELEKPDFPFGRYDGVVMVTKVLWPKDLDLLQQMICVFNAAYNRHVGYYDIVVFTSLPWTVEQVNELQEVASPANLTVVNDTPPLEDVLATMAEDEVSFLKQRCGCADNETLSWFHYCNDQGQVSNLGYAWQAEFRSYHIWKEPILAKYKYMIWMDSDALPTKMWDVDPIKLMVENDLVLMFDNFPAGVSPKRGTSAKLMKAYNKTICKLTLTNKGHFKNEICNVPQEKSLPDVHGFHHITNLDFYRSERTMRFLKIWVSDYKFSRKFDDQAAVTLPAAMDAPDRSWDYEMNGLNMSIFHNTLLDGKYPAYHRAYHRSHWGWNRKVWVAGAKMCNAFITVGG